ncbi:MAG: L,D-transpeptidase family protein [bacterium]|nr:L,D-transpeptidase family protein [bacterium]
MIKRALLIGVVLLLIASLGALLVWYAFFRTPFAQQYQHAVLQLEAQPASAHPILQRALRVYQNTPEFPAALYHFARCETLLNPTNTAVWEAVLNCHTDRHILAEARYHLALHHPNRLAALEAFVRDFPDHTTTPAILAELAAAAEAQGDTLKTHFWWQLLVDRHPHSTEARAAREKLGPLNIKLLCSPRPLPFTTKHTVQRGETILAIAKRYTNTVDQIKRINNLKSDVISPGVTLKIDLSRYLIDVSLSKHLLTLYRIWQNSTNFVKTYPIGTGKENNTPRGTFRITLRQQNPTWYRPGSAPIPFGSPENQLGTRWLGIDAQGYGIHGTWEPETIGGPTSAGCIRMHNQDVEELYDLVRVGTPVIIHD